MNDIALPWKRSSEGKKVCRNGIHSVYNGAQIGFGFEFDYERYCNRKEGDVADGFREPDSAASGHHLLEVTNSNEY
jgi:hypothetical protein